MTIDQICIYLREPICLSHHLDISLNIYSQALNISWTEIGGEFAEWNYATHFLLCTIIAGPKRHCSEHGWEISG